LDSERLCNQAPSGYCGALKHGASQIIHSFIHNGWQPFRGADGANGIEPALIGPTHKIPATIIIVHIKYPGPRPRGSARIISVHDEKNLTRL